MDVGVADRGWRCAGGWVQQSMIIDILLIAVGFCVGAWWAAWMKQQL